MNRQIIVISLIVAAILVIAMFIIVALKFKNTPQTIKIKTKKQEQKQLTLQDLINIASDRSSSKNELFEALKIFATSFKLPPKTDGKVSTEAKVYLRFIVALASNPKADAKLIAFMNNELKKANPEYLSEIETYEKEGIGRRTNF